MTNKEVIIRKNRTELLKEGFKNLDKEYLNCIINDHKIEWEIKGKYNNILIVKCFDCNKKTTYEFW